MGNELGFPLCHLTFCAGIVGFSAKRYLQNGEQHEYMISKLLVGT
jgi:hypothetical protein